MMKLIGIISLFVIISDAQKCIPRQFDENSIVCVCNSTYCDTVAVIMPDKGQFRRYISSRNGQRLDTDVSNFNTDIKNGDGIILNLNTAQTYQSIHGFGGAFTDAAGINIRMLSEKTQEVLLEAYYGEDGNRYNLGRVPVGGTDFSTRPYTLDDNPGDVKLSNFSLAKEDNDYKIPYMKRALQLNPETKFFAASWTAPPWMKTNDNYRGFLGFLKKKYYQTYAEYLVKFLITYKNEGLPIWAISTGNEPADVFIPLTPINDMGWTPSSEAAFIVNNLGPTIANSSSNQTLIWALDDQRLYLPWYINDMFRDNYGVEKYIGGIAVHWYADQIIPPTVFDKTHAAHPDKYIIMTEACTGSQPWDFKKVRLGSWSRGEKYMFSMIDVRSGKHKIASMVLCNNGSSHIQKLSRENKIKSLTQFHLLSLWVEKIIAGLHYDSIWGLMILGYEMAHGEYTEYNNSSINKNDLNHWITGWVDWNLVLDKKGGPNWSKNNVDAAIIVNPEADEFFKQPMYYAIAHFSKFISRGSVRVDLTVDDNIKSVAFLTPQNTIVVVLLNKDDVAKNVAIVDPNQGNINVEVAERSIQTIIYRQ